MFPITPVFYSSNRKLSRIQPFSRARMKVFKKFCKHPGIFRLMLFQQIESSDDAFNWFSLKCNLKLRRARLKSICGSSVILDFSIFALHGVALLQTLLETKAFVSVAQARRLDALLLASFFWLAFWFQWLYPFFLPSLGLALSHRYLIVYGQLPIRKRRRGLGVAQNMRNMLLRSAFLRQARSFTRVCSYSALFVALAKPIRFLRFGRSKRVVRFLSPQTRAYPHFPRFTNVRRRLFWFLRRKRRSRFFFLRNMRARLRALKYAFPRRAIREFRFIRKYKALFTVRALHTNLFFTIRQGHTFFQATTGMFDDLKRGTKRKRTLMAGWFLADRLFDKVGDSLKSKSIFRINVHGRTSGRRGIWFSWRTKNWRIYQVYSNTPIAFNGTRARRKRRL